MTARRAALAAAIFLAALAVVGLILLRPVPPTAYAAGPFRFEAVTEIQVSAGVAAQGGPDAPDMSAPVVAVGPEDGAFEELIALFEGRGFGRTFRSLFTSKAPQTRVGDPYWNATFLCGLTGASLTVTCRGADVRFEDIAVSAREKTAWARRVHECILALYPEEPAPDAAE